VDDRARCEPELSAHFKSRRPSAIRTAYMEYLKRNDGVGAINVAIGNVSLPMHPAMTQRLFNLDAPESPFREGVIGYTPTVGLEETTRAFLNIIASSGFSTRGLYPQVTDGASQAMELVFIGAGGPAGSGERPILLIDPAYINYVDFGRRLGRKTLSVQRRLHEDGVFSLPDVDEIEEVIDRSRPGAVVVIPYDNPTGHFMDDHSMVLIARLCVEYNMWMVSDETYRELLYTGDPTSSIWGIDDDRVPGIEGRRISIETASKVWNACGLRIGALVTDSGQFHEKSVAEYTANLCANAVGQYVFGALAHEDHGDLQSWYERQRAHYRDILGSVNEELSRRMPGVVVSSPVASIYSVIDLKNLVEPDFDIHDFVMYCAREGNLRVNGENLTLLVAPMTGFYNADEGTENPGKTQVRIAHVQPADRMRLVPLLFSGLFEQYRARARNRKRSIPTVRQ
jgi:aspartate aminotransferase